MEVHILTENVQKKLAFVNKAISSKSQLPILLNFLLETKNGKLRISATDLEIGIHVDIPAQIIQAGTLTVPARLFHELLASLPTGKITLKQTETGLAVNGKTTHTIFQIAPPDDFPNLYGEKGELLAILKPEALKKDLSMVVFASSLDTTRPALSGVLVKKAGDVKEEFLFVATDGYRLSLKKSLSEKAIGEIAKSEKEITMLIPSRVLKEVMNMQQGEAAIKVYVAKDSNQVVFETDDALLVGRLLDAQYPPYDRIIPSEHATRVVFDSEQVQKAVKICAIFAKDSANIVKFSFKKDMVIVSANMPSVGENSVEVEATLDGEENEIAFNAKYLLDFFANVEAGEMQFEMTGPLNPGVFKIKGDDSFLHIIMPIRVQA